MKKIIAILFAMVMILAVSPSYFAAPETKEPTSYDMSGEVNFNFGLSGDAIDEQAASFMKTIENINIVYNGTVRQASETDVQLYCDLTVKAGVFNVPLKVWLDLNMTDIENIDYEIILELPPSLTGMLGADFANKKYIVFDYGYMLDENREILSAFSANLTPEYIAQTTEIGEQFEADLKAKIEEIVTTETVAGGTYKLTVNNAQAAELIIAGVDAYVSFMEDNMDDIYGQMIPSTIEGVDPAEIETMRAEMQASVDEVMAMFRAEQPKVNGIIRSVELFPGEGIVHEYDVNSDGYVTREKGRVNFKLDFLAVANEVIKAYPDLGPIPADQDNFIFTMVIDYANKYENINTAAPIAYPVPTDENSYNVFKELMAQQAAYEAELAAMRNRVTVYYNDAAINFTDAQPVIMDGRTMVPANAVFTELGGQLEYVVVDGVQTIKGTLGDKTISFNIGSNVATVNGSDVALDVAPYINNYNRTMVPLRFIAENFGLTVEFEGSAYGNWVNIYTAEYFTQIEADRAALEAEINAMMEEGAVTAPAPEGILTN